MLLDDFCGMCFAVCMMVRHPLKTWRREHEMTLRELAEAAATTEGHLSNIERCTRDPSFKLAHKLAEITGLSLEQIAWRP